MRWFNPLPPKVVGLSVSIVDSLYICTRIRYFIDILNVFIRVHDPILFYPTTKLAIHNT